MLNIGGENVFPHEIAEVLNMHQTVQCSAVISKSDRVRGEVPIAGVEIEYGYTFDEAALRQWCRNKLAQCKIPRDMCCLNALPRNTTGKIRRRQLPIE